MRGGLVLGLLACASVASGSSWAACGPDAIGTSRTITLKREAAAYGTAQHAALPLAPGEVVLTFDDGPRPESTPKVLATLSQQCARATFFMVGEHLARNPELAREVRAQGHSVGAHGNTHAHAPQQSPAEQLADMNAAQAAYQQAFGTPTPAWRFPFLEETPTMTGALQAQAITTMSIDVAIDDWLPGQTPQMLADRLVERLAKVGRGIILMHDVEDGTAAALPLLLATLKAHGYRVVHLEWEPAAPGTMPRGG